MVEPQEEQGLKREREVVQTPVVGCIDWTLDRLRFFQSHEGLFERIRTLLVTVGLWASLGVGALALLFGIVEAFRWKSFYPVWMGLGGVLAMVVVHYCAARFVGAGRRIIAEQPQRMSSGAVLDCLGLLAVLLAITGVIAGVTGGGWLPVIIACALAVVALFCLNPREMVNTEIVAENVSAGETGLSILTFGIRCVLAAAPLLFGIGLAVCAVWGVVGMISAWAGKGFGLAEALAGAVVLALLPLITYVFYLFYMMAVDFYLAVLRTAENTRRD